MIRFDNEEDFVEIDIADSESDNTGDRYLTIKVQSAGFCGANDLWIHGAEFKAFCSGIIAVEEKRQGQVTLKSISPGELDLTIKSVSSLGHFVIVGVTGYEVQREHAMIDHSISFGFEFDPGQLYNASKVTWVTEAAT